MAKSRPNITFNFGANVKPKKRKKAKQPKKRGGKANAWTAYVTGKK
jgi:hypothetical protein